MEEKEITNEEKEILILKDKCELVINKTEKPNSYEFGKAGNRFKIYFSDVIDLQIQLKGIVDAGLAVEDDFKKEEVVHHININKADNNLSNLMLFETHKKHMQFHMKIIQFGYTNPILRQIEERWKNIK